MIRNLIQNWKTTSAGIAMIAGSIIHLVFSIKNGTADEMVWTVTVTAVLGGLGLVFAGDSSTSQKQIDATQAKVADAIETGNTDQLKKP